MKLKLASMSVAITLGLAAAEQGGATTNHLTENAGSFYHRREMTDPNKATPTDEQVACLTREDCEKVSQEMGAESFNYGDYGTKGCFLKNNKVFFSLGTEEKMSEPELNGVQERIWCGAPTLSPTKSLTPTPTLDVLEEPTTANPSILNMTTPTDEQIACLIREDCEKVSQGMGVELFFFGEYNTKGCFLKNGKVFFSLGTEEEMSEPKLSGLQERIWCGAPTSSPTKSLTPTGVSTPTLTPTDTLAFVVPVTNPGRSGDTAAPNAIPGAAPTSPNNSINAPTKVSLILDNSIFFINRLL